jgi:hypothetical protein
MSRFMVTRLMPLRVSLTVCACSVWSGLADEKRRGTNQCTVVDLAHEEVGDIGTTDNAESPVVSRGQDVVIGQSRADRLAGPAGQWSSRARKI